MKPWKQVKCRFAMKEGKKYNKEEKAERDFWYLDTWHQRDSKKRLVISFDIYQDVISGGGK